jgi:hypothetical protein
MRAAFENGGVLTSPWSHASGLSWGLIMGSICHIVNLEGADLVREKLRVRRMKSERFVVVERRDLADAILTGVAGVERK